VDWLSFGLLNHLGLYYLVSAVFAFILGLAVNFLLSKLLVFQSGTDVSGAVEFTIYIIIGAIGLAFTELLLFLFTDIIGLHPMISKIIAAAIVLIWNFFARKIILYTNQGAILWKRKRQL